MKDGEQEEEKDEGRRVGRVVLVRAPERTERTMCSTSQKTESLQFPICRWSFCQHDRSKSALRKTSTCAEMPASSVSKRARRRVHEVFP